MLSRNMLSGGLDQLLGCPAINHLDLSFNKFESFDDLLPLAKLKYLKKLELSCCPIVEEANYRKKIFALIPTLKYLDKLDK